jgi:predicted alpha/beta-fold hydrolase
MPLVAHSSYKPVWYLFNKHLETIVPNKTRKVTTAAYTRTRLELTDGDFLDLDWLKGGRSKLAIISHGLEGNSMRTYCRGMAKFFFARGWDALAWNCRSCSGELNRLARFYHHGDTADLGFVVDEAIRQGYREIVLIGFSMGGSFSLKYTGEKGSGIPGEVKGCIAFSVPCDLAAGARAVDGRGNGIYRKRFIAKLRKKILEKSRTFPNDIDSSKLSSIETLDAFNNQYTASLHGFKDSDDFYQRSSCLHYLAGIRVPSLLVNAANDPMLTPECFPSAIAEKSQHLFLEVPQRGGHVGFALTGKEENWMEVRAIEFVKEVIEL